MEPPDVVDQPLVLYHDAEMCILRAAQLPASIRDNADTFSFRGSRFVRTGCGIAFWDYLIRRDGDIVGVVLNDFDVAPSLESSRLLTASSNVTRDDYGYYVKLVTTDADPDIDSSQAFGSSLFECDGECVLVLPDWHRRGYAFHLDAERITPSA